MRQAVAIGATGFGLIAVCYGFARYAFGLFLPAIAVDLALSPSASGFISGAAFVSYCLAIGSAAWLTEKLGPRTVAVAAGIVAALGMAGMAAAPSATLLGIAVVIAGASTGLASPPLAAAVAAGVARRGQDTVNTVINTGTSAGVALSGPVAMLMGAGWRLAFAGFAAAALLTALAGWRMLPRRGPETQRPAPMLPALTPDLTRLVLASFLTGAASAVVWTFGAELAALNLEWTGARAGLLWIAVGAAGIAGAGAGRLAARYGINPVLLGLQGASMLAIVCVGYDTGMPVVVLGGGAVFGAAYMLLSGIYLLWGVSALPDRPAMGVMLAFLSLSVGQAIGASVFGVLQEHGSPDSAVLGFAALAILAAGVRRQAPAAAREGRRANAGVAESQR